MRNLSEIIEDCKLNKKPSVDELRYSVIALTGLLNLAVNNLLKFYTDDTHPLDKMLIENTHQAYQTALNKSPKEWLGWSNDPENPEYQRFHHTAIKLFDMALKGELPNQKHRSNSNGNS